MDDGIQSSHRGPKHPLHSSPTGHKRVMCNSRELPTGWNEVKCTISLLRVFCILDDKNFGRFFALSGCYESICHTIHLGLLEAGKTLTRTEERNPLLSRHSQPRGLLLVGSRC